MDLWQKLTIDWPCALGDWLWAVLVVAPAAFLDRLTFRLTVRIVLQIALFVLFLRFFAQLAALDLTPLFAIDVTAFMEIGATIFVLAAQGCAGRVVAVAIRRVTPVVQRWSNRLRRSRQRRNANALRRKSGSSKQADDEPAVWGWLVQGAFA